MVLQELARIGFSNIQDYLHPGNNVRDLTQLPKEKVAAVESIQVEEIEVDESVVKRKTKFKLYSKLSALEKLGQHLGMFNDKTPARALPPVTDQDETERA